MVIYLLVFFSYFCWGNLNDQVPQRVMDELVERRGYFFYARFDVVVRSSDGNEKRLSFGDGGGIWDFDPLADQLPQKVEFINWFVDFEKYYPNFVLAKVFFLPFHRPIEVQGVIFGSPCDEILNITRFAKISILSAKSGFKVPYPFGRQILGFLGLWYFAFDHLGERFLAKLSITSKTLHSPVCR